MKEKKIGDVIIFDYDVYDIENNIDVFYDYTARLMGVVTEVIPSATYGTKYKARLTKVISAHNESCFAPGSIIDVDDDKIYRGAALHNVVYNGLCDKPTIAQIERFMEMYNDKKTLGENLKEIADNWYKHGLEKYNLYDKDEFVV